MAFSVSVTRETTKYSDFLYTADLSQLVSFSALIGIDVRQKVALADYTEIERIVKESWVSISSSKFILQ